MSDQDASTFKLPGDSEATRQIGPYRLLAPLGEGGMGMVYLAEQQQPVQRKVALKIIKPGMDSREVIGRFETERQALAVMNHPHIAKVFDAGTTDGGRPYFVMEHVPGLPITDYCDRHRLTTRARLELFISVCHAVHHAHQKGIIHRDLKPSNVLVAVQDGKPVAKVIDFGVAKATETRLTESTVFTEQGQLIGTPEYMSPEQAEMTGLNIDTTTDVYSLGVLLYRLLTGKLPFQRRELIRAGLAAIQRVIREVDPPRPSTKISSLGQDEATAAAERRRMAPRNWLKQIRGELDWITMRAMEKDRTRRYQSASEFAADINRYLAQQPVLARRPSATYQLRKLVARHKVRFGLTVSLAVMVIGFAVTMSVQAGRIARERDRANREATTALQVSDFVVGLFEVSDPSEARGNSVTAREILDAGADHIAQDLADQPLVQARLMDTMGNVYTSLGLYGQAQPLFEQALQSRQERLDDEHLDIAESQNNLANLLRRTGDYEQASRLYDSSRALYEQALGGGHPLVAMSLHNLAILHKLTGEFELARQHFERALAIRERTLGPDDPTVASSCNSLANVLRRMGEHDLARRHYERALAIREATHGSEHPEVSVVLGNFATLLADTGDFEGARALYERSIAIREKTLGPDHPELASDLDNLAALYHDQRDFASALPLSKRALAIREKAFGPNSPILATSLHNYANLVSRSGDNAEARRIHERVRDLRERVLGPDHPDLGRTYGCLANIALREDDYDAARPLYERSLAIMEKSLGPDHRSVAHTLSNFAILLVEIGDLAGARQCYARALAIREQVLGPNHRVVTANLYDLACLAALAGERDTAIAYLRQAVDRGYEDQNLWIARDGDLAVLHGDAEFEAIVAELAAGQQ